jgi:hypothetical protein
MACVSCNSAVLGSRPGVFAALSRAAAKSAGAKLRAMRLMLARPDWPARAEVCERCPMRVVACGVSYCGTPFLRKVDRDPVVDGCGCPTIVKAKDPGEHCPVNRSNQAAKRGGHGGCDCRWCAGDAASKLAG